MNNNNQIEELNRKLQEEENKKEKKKIIILLLLILLLIILIILWTHAIQKPTITLGEKDINQNYTPSPLPSPIPTPTIIENNIIHEITRPITIINNYTTIIEQIITQTPAPSPSPQPSPTPDIDKEFIVSSKNKKWTETLNIFDNNKYGGNPIIYPGIENTYKFEFTNEKDYDIECSIKFEETNRDNIPIKYKLKENGQYIKGDKNTYVNYNELDTKNILVNANSQNTYELEWKWEEGSNDNKYGDTTKTIKYALQITVEAEQKTK